MLTFDPLFRDPDWMTRQLPRETVGTITRPAVRPFDAGRDGAKFVVDLDLPVVAP
jgi:hypothetical protein